MDELIWGVWPLHYKCLRPTWVAIANIPAFPSLPARFLPFRSHPPKSTYVQGVEDAVQVPSVGPVGSREVPWSSMDVCIFGSYRLTVVAVYFCLQDTLRI